MHYFYLVSYPECCLCTLDKSYVVSASAIDNLNGRYECILVSYITIPFKIKRGILNKGLMYLKLNIFIPLNLRLLILDLSISFFDVQCKI